MKLPKKGQTVFDRFVHKYGRLPTETDPDYLEMLRMSKYVLENVPRFKPGKCGNCGASKEDGRQYVNFGLEVDWYGVVYLCTLCLADIARNTNLYAELQAEIARLKAQLISQGVLVAQAEDVKNTVLHTYEEVKSYFDNVSAISATSSSDGSDRVDSDEAASDDKRGDGSEQGTTKQTTVTRSENVPSIAELFS